MRAAATRALHDSASPDDGELISRDVDAPRLCLGELRSVGVQQVDARNLGHLRDVASDLRGRGLERSRDGVLTPGLFDLVLNRGHYLALFFPKAPPARGAV